MNIHIEPNSGIPNQPASGDQNISNTSGASSFHVSPGIPVILNVSNIDIKFQTLLIEVLKVLCPYCDEYQDCENYCKRKKRSFSHPCIINRRIALRITEKAKKIYT